MGAGGRWSSCVLAWERGAPGARVCVCMEARVCVCLGRSLELVAGEKVEVLVLPLLPPSPPAPLSACSSSRESLVPRTNLQRDVCV